MGLTGPKHLGLNENIQVGYMVFAQSVNNASTVVVPSNNNKLEITLKNSQSDNSSSSTYVQLITGLSSAGAAIFGGYFASYISNKNAREIEKTKQAAEQEKEREFGRKTRAIIYSQLKSMSVSLAAFKDDSDIWEAQRTGNFDIATVIIWVIEHGKELLRIPLENRIKLFSPVVLVNVQDAFEHFDTFSHMVGALVDEYKQDKTIKKVENLAKQIANLQPELLLSEVNNAIKLIEQTYPEVKDDAKDAEP